MAKYELRNKKRQTESDADEKGADTKKSKAEKPSRSSTKILSLNDDCFDEIFGYLSYDDVLSASQVCHRFEDRARDVFKRKKHNLKMFSVKANDAAKRNLLRRIGPALSRLEIFFVEDVIENQRTIGIATKYCLDNLTDITLHCLTKRNKLRKSFNRVNNLTLSYCDLIGRFPLVKWFPNLTSVTFHHTKNLKKFMKQKIPTLRTLKLDYVTTFTETITMLTANPQIKNLSLNFECRFQGGLVVQQNLLTAIDKALPDLQTLNLAVDRVRNFEVQNLTPHFKQLKTLKIENYSEYSNSDLINQLVISDENLERLQLRFSDLSRDPHSYSCIIKFKNLRIIQVMPVQRSLSMNEILMLASQLPRLERIEQTADFTNTDPWSSEDVVNFHRSSSQLKELTFVFDIEAQAKFNRAVSFNQAQFNGSDWTVKNEERLSHKIFDTNGTYGAYADNVLQKQFVIRIVKNC